MTIYSADKCHVTYAIGADIDTTFRNDDDALLLAEIQAIDKIDARQNVEVDFTDPLTEPAGSLSGSHYVTQHTTGYRIGKMVLPMFLQTGVFLGATLGGISTAAGYIHTITLKATQTPLYLGLHFEKEMTDKDIRVDFLGYMPNYWRMYCGDDPARWKARQIFAADFAFNKAGGDLLEPSKQDLSIYEWNDLKHASGELSLKYNGTDLEFDIRAFDLTIKRTKPLWGVKGASGYPASANIAGVGIEFLLEGYLTGDNVRTLMATKPESYLTTYLDGVIKFYKTATREFGVNLNNVYLVPDKDILNETDWYERKTLKCISWDSTLTSVAGSVEDTLDATYYENE